MSPLSPARPDADRALDLQPVARDVWDAFVHDNRDALLFHTWDWAELLVGVYGLDWHPLGVWSRGNLVGLFPIFARKLGLFHLAGSPIMQVIASTPFLGPLISSDQIPATLRALEPLLSSWRVDHIEIALPQLLEDVKVIEDLGYSTEICQSVVVHLEGRSQEEVWSGLSSACRRAVRKARASGVQTVAPRDEGFLDEYYAMCQEVYRGSGRPPHLSQEFYVSAWRALADQGTIKALLAVQGGRVLAGGIFLLHDGIAYYLSGASYDDGLPLRPNNLIQWSFMEGLIAGGYRYYDMGGAVVPGITRFKLSFGGELVPYTRLYRACSLGARVGRKAYARLIPLWRRLQARWSRAHICQRVLFPRSRWIRSSLCPYAPGAGHHRRRESSLRKHVAMTSPGFSRSGDQSVGRRRSCPDRCP